LFLKPFEALIKETSLHYLTNNPQGASISKMQNFSVYTPHLELANISPSLPPNHNRIIMIAQNRLSPLEFEGFFSLSNRLVH